MSRVELNLTNYPELQRLYGENKQEFGRVLKHSMEHLDKSLAKNRFQYAQDVYKMDYLDMLDQLADTFMDVAPIIDKHHNKAEGQALLGLQADLHPLAIFTNNAAVYNAKGQNIAPSEWIRQDKFDLKDWLYGLFYGARFVSWQELAEYITVGEFDLMDVLKARNFPQLARIQPALSYQQTNHVPVGKLIKGTGFLDGGDAATQNLDRCPSCDSENWITKKPGIAYCESCSLGGLK